MEIPQGKKWRNFHMGEMLKNLANGKYIEYNAVSHVAHLTWPTLPWRK